MVIGSGNLSHEIMLNNSKITSSNEEKLLGIFLDSKLNFESHRGSLCRKAGRNTNALARLKNYLTSNQRNLQLNSVIKSQFTYCPLICMFTSRYLNNGLACLHQSWMIFSSQDETFIISESFRNFPPQLWISVRKLSLIEVHNCGT